jgi:hypothetical protein
MPGRLRVVDRVQKLLVFQLLIYRPHPRFPQLGNFLGEQSFPQTGLLVPQLDHWLPRGAAASFTATTRSSTLRRICSCKITAQE